MKFRSISTRLYLKSRHHLEGKFVESRWLGLGFSKGYRDYRDSIEIPNCACVCFFKLRINTGVIKNTFPRCKVLVIILIRYKGKVFERRMLFRHFCQFFSLKRSHRSGMLSITRENHPMEALGVVQYISIYHSTESLLHELHAYCAAYIYLYTSFSLTKVISWNQRNDPKCSNPLSQVTTFFPKHKNKHTQKKIKARYLLGVGLRSSVSIFCWPTIRVTPTALQSLQPTPLRWRARSGAKPNVPQGEFFGGVGTNVWTTT